MKSFYYIFFSFFGHAGVGDLLTSLKQKMA
ncbi:hypothetical protein R69927_00440 [Paraburkholderia domus]|uniref:Uncharacterized protein n=1 Tax=Paraburkholderia domus TaxID=2793075 RepID=A0A9N8MJR2_9BURK|nr:hypothetical protein R70006_00420 [Paraburkholderia domus]CAE6792099.1 hypothetical protein R69749_02198 [Paraburkholderia domus]CAE6816242.1 hypothetical protein R69927_00440 [Paraburkholderia domus]CAE6861081.1 hypothetical protein R70211_00471 [Paraburkholderia domus]CAE6881399.1 hypothetical protein R75471_01825 [Paraburkholderia domus]